VRHAGGQLCLSVGLQAAGCLSVGLQVAGMFIFINFKAADVEQFKKLIIIIIIIIILKQIKYSQQCIE
jgi:hypothetical protein